MSTVRAEVTACMMAEVLLKHTHTHIGIYIYVCVCVQYRTTAVHVWQKKQSTAVQAEHIL
jgi:hypothetical protein